jgi:hypothetical protein
VQHTAELTSTASPDALMACVDDLARYPGWLSLVRSVADAEPHPEDLGQAWVVELRARLGPLARSKRLRMVRVERTPQRVRFERHERDGRAHSAWVLDAVVDPDPGGSRLTMQLSYSGTFGGGVVEVLLAEEIRRATPKLRTLAEQ